MNAKDYEAEWKWMNSSPEAKQLSDATNSSPELTLIQIAKQLGECCFQMGMAPGRTR